LKTWCFYDDTQPDTGTRRFFKRQRIKYGRPLKSGPVLPQKCGSTASIVSIKARSLGSSATDVVS
jgi:hypothetical protein